MSEFDDEVDLPSYINVDESGDADDRVCANERLSCVRVVIPCVGGCVCVCAARKPHVPEQQ